MNPAGSSYVRVVTHLERCALRKIGKLEDQGFMFTRFERITGDAALLSGGPTRVLKRGPNRGKTRVTAITHKVTVTDAELEAERLAYELETGLCATCSGAGREACGWSVDGGTTYRPCKRCQTTGKAVAR